MDINFSPKFFMIDDRKENRINSWDSSKLFRNVYNILQFYTKTNSNFSDILYLLCSPLTPDSSFNRINSKLLKNFPNQNKPIRFGFYQSRNS